ncbi:hypothetical protein M422DRAFT_258017 [Sphaerobolus stellatus SS14]|uniref:Major facilitator superfamily (MFS) profile domain-containing protein n=1 Tax=Sphaerobolus stellatus (strain SS14) TaxID=990650 RepID=A0A0C9U7Z2_SPHS4|nr:hypothetical protein M422DRAFT_258017 [Sphaerobolus stellatus SS14]
MAGVASLAASPQEVGARVGIGLAVVSVGLLVSAPVQGALLGSSFQWIRPVAFSGSVVLASTVFYIVVGYTVAKRKNG